MGWIIFMILAWTTALIIVPLKGWKKSWPVGLLAMIILLVIDNALVYLGAIKFWHGNIYVYDLPLYYWLAYFPGGIVFDHYRPNKHIWRLCYIFIWAAAYLLAELAMIYFGYFQHLNWSVYRACLLNVGGFTITMWYAEWLEEWLNEGTIKSRY